MVKGSCVMSVQQIVHGTLFSINMTTYMRTCTSICQCTCTCTMMSEFFGAHGQKKSYLALYINTYFLAQEQ